MVDEQTGAVVAGHMQNEIDGEEEDKDSDSDFNDDDDIYLRQARDQRMAEMKTQQN